MTWQSNSSSTEPTAQCNKTQEVFFLVAYAVVGALMFAGNAFVCLVFIASKKLRRNYMNIFLLSLSVSDMLMAVLVIPFYTVHCFQDCLHSLTHYCWLLSKARDFAFGATTLNICAITYDRYLAILRPLQYSTKMTRLRVAVVLSAVWLLPLVVATTRNVWYHTTEEQNRHLTGKLYDIAIIIVPVILSQTVMVLVNINIICKIQKHKKPARRFQALSAANQLNLLQAECKSTKEVSRLRKGTTSCVVVVLTFVACWLPKTVHNFSYVADTPDTVLSSPLFFRICFLFLFIQSSFNPFIYSFYRAQFRKAARTIITRWRGC